MKTWQKMVTTIITIIMMMGNIMTIASAAVEKISEENLEEKIQRYIEERKEETASVSLSVFKDGETIYQTQAGYTDVENKVKANKDSIYEWGSVSKMLTWVAIMQLEEQGKIDLDTNVNKYLPQDFKDKVHFKYDITVKDLMNHQAGFQEIVIPIEYNDAKDIPDFKEILINSYPGQIYKPGTTTAYSNWGASLAAYIVENQTGKPFYQYANENIFAPLGMKHTSLKPDWSDNVFVQKGRAKVKTYLFMEGVKESYGQGISYIGLYPAGSCAGTLEDFTTFAQEFTREDSKLFKNKATLDKIKTPTSTYSDTEIGRVYHGMWSIDYGAKLLGHSGNTSGFTSSFWFDPISNIGYTVMTNEVGETAYNYGIAELLFGRQEMSEHPSDRNISGIYTSGRTIEDGFSRYIKYIAGILPIKKTDKKGNFEVAVGGISIQNLGNNIYQQSDNNGLVYQLHYYPKEGKFETYTTDYFKLPISELILVVILLVTLLLNLIIGVVLSIRLIIRKVRHKAITAFSVKNHIAMWMAMVITGIFLYLWLSPESYNMVVVKILCIIAGLFALFLLANFIHQLYNRIKHHNTKTDMVSATFYMLSAITVLFFQLYKFW